MNCEQAKVLIGPYADGELEAVAVLELEEHLQSCAGCALAWRNLQGLKKTLKADAFYFTAPDELRQRIKAALPLPSEPAVRRRGWSWSWLTAATSLAGAFCLALVLLATMTRPSAEQRLEQEVVSSHIRSLMASHALDVVSTDQHTVKPWFNGKLDFAPPVKDLAAEQFPLIGGRLDYVDGRAVAALVYQRQKHIINLFIWPASEADSKPTAVAVQKGFNQIRWSEGGMVFRAVSDLNEKELMEFAQDLTAP